MKVQHYRGMNKNFNIVKYTYSLYSFGELAVAENTKIFPLQHYYFCYLTKQNKFEPVIEND